MTYLVLYLIASSVGNILIHLFGIQMPGKLMALLTTTYAIIIFHLLAVNVVFSTYRKLCSVKALTFATLLSVALMWLFTFYISIYYSPAIQIFALVGFTSCYGSFFTYLTNQKLIELLKSIFIFVLLVVFYMVMHGQYPSNKFYILLLSSFVMGTSAYAYLASTFQLSKLQFKVTEILAVRFWLLWIILLCLVLSSHELNSVDLSAVLKTFLLSLVTLVLPIYLSQKSVEKIGANLTGILIGLMPFVTFAFEKMFLNIRLNVVGYFSIALAIFISLPYLVDRFYRLFQKKMSTTPR